MPFYIRDRTASILHFMCKMHVTDKISAFYICLENIKYSQIKHGLQYWEEDGLLLRCKSLHDMSVTYYTIIITQTFIKIFSLKLKIGLTILFIKFYINSIFILHI